MLFFPFTFFPFLKKKNWKHQNLYLPSTIFPVWGQEIKSPRGDRTHQLSLCLFSCDCQWLHWKRMCDLSTCFKGRKSKSLPLEKAFLMCHGMHTDPWWKRSSAQTFSPMTSWTLCLPSFLFTSQISKFCHTESKQTELSTVPTAVCEGIKWGHQCN